MTAIGPRRRRIVRLGSYLLLTLIPAAALAAAAAADLDASRWAARVDAPATPPAKAAVKSFAIPFPPSLGNGGEITYPTTPSPFVVLGKNFFDNDARQVWNLATKTLVGTFRGKLGLDDKTIALSPDGAYLAGKQTHGRSVEVRASKTGRVAQSFDLDSPFLDFIDFAAGDRLVFGRLADAKLQVADIKGGDKVCDLAMASKAERQGVAVSPGRAYLAAASWPDGMLRVYDLADGKVVGEAPTPRVNGQVVRCFGLAYSPDGSELAGLFEHFGAYRIVCWKADDGKAAADFDLGKEIRRPNFYEAEGIGWFPDRSAWLVLGHAIVDRRAGKRVWTLPFDDAKLKPGPRRFLDDSTALVVTTSPAKALVTAEVPRDKVAAGAELVRSGGSASDASLPPIKAADWSGVKREPAAAKPAGWSVKPGQAPQAPHLTSRLVALQAKAEDVRGLLFPGPGSREVFVVETPNQPGQANGSDGQPRRVERVDLASGKAGGRVDLPVVSDPIAVSPDGSMLLLREAAARDRLDVYAASAKPVAGWRPYEKESGDDRAVTWADFLDANRVLTINAGGTLALWSVPECKAIYAVDDAFQGAPALDAGRKLLAGCNGTQLRVLDAATGLVLGASEVKKGRGPRIEPKAVAFRHDGARVAAQFSDRSVTAWDLATGQVAAEYRPGVPLPGSALAWEGDDHILIDNRSLVDLRSKRQVWEYAGASAGAVGPDGRHWFAARGVAGKEGATLLPLDLPDAAAERAETLMADPKAPSVIRPGARVGVRLDIGGPPRDPAGYRQGLLDALAAKLKANGLTPVEDGAPTPKGPGPVRVGFARFAGPDARLVLTTREVDTGHTIQYRTIGRGRAVQVVKLVDVACEMTLVDALGSVPVQSYAARMQPFGFILRMPAGEADPELYLKKLQWDRIKVWALNPGPPYFVARDGNEVVTLPGRTDLNAEAAR